MIVERDNITLENLLELLMKQSVDAMADKIAIFSKNLNDVALVPFKSRKYTVTG